MTKTKDYLTNWVGFDDLFKTFDSILDGNRKFVTQSFPPYNIKRTSENSYTIEMALAGFGKTDIDVTIDGNELKVSGKIEQKTEDYLYKGISERSFNKSFTLADNVVVKNAEMVNGMLKIILDAVLPYKAEARKLEVK